MVNCVFFGFVVMDFFFKGKMDVMIEVMKKVGFL